MSKSEWKKLGKDDWKKWLGVWGRMLLVYVLVFSQGTWAGQNENAKDKPGGPQNTVTAHNAAAQQKASAAAPAKAAAEAEQSEGAVGQEKKSNDPSHEGIKVHGHWTIEVRNSDGTLARHVEFENSLTPSTGAPTLANLLNSGGNKLTQPFVWGVVLVGIGCGSFNVNDINMDTMPLPGCTIAQPSPSSNPLSSYYIVPANSYQLTTSVSGGTFALNGTIQFAGSVGTVITGVATETIALVNQGFQTTGCFDQLFSGTNPCLPIPTNQFTSFSLPTAQQVQVNAGQTIAVTVNISFS